jgi:hypothetical protein
MAGRISSRPVNTMPACGIRQLPSGVNKPAKPSQSRIIAESANSIGSAWIASRSAIP